MFILAVDIRWFYVNLVLLNLKIHLEVRFDLRIICHEPRRLDDPIVLLILFGRWGKEFGLEKWFIQWGIIV